MALRDLFLGVNFDVNEKELRAGDNAMDSLADETKRAGSSMRTLDRNSKKVGTSLRSIGRTIGAFVGIYELGRGLKYSLEQASDLNEETDKFNTVFGEMRREAGLWAEEYAQRTNASVVETRSAIAENQNLLVGFGATRKQGFMLATQMQELAGDLSAMNNIEKDLVANNLQSVMLGQHKAGKTLGLAITEASLAQEALSQGYKETFRNLDPLVKMQLRFDLAMKQSQDSIGKAESEAQTFAGQMRGMKASFRDTAAIAGQQLIPVVGQLLQGFNDNKEAIVGMVVNGVNVAAAGFNVLIGAGKVAITTFNTFEPLIWGLTAGFVAFKTAAAVSGVINGVSMSMAGMTAITEAGTIAVWANSVGLKAMGIAAAASSGPIALLNAMWAASPLGVVAIGVGAVVTGMRLLYKHSERFQKFWDSKISPIWDKIAGFLGLGVEDREEIGINTSDAGINQYATGTSNAKKGLALVGENGPELRYMQGGERIINNSNTKRILSNNNQNVNVNIVVNGNDDPVKTSKLVRNEMENYFRRSRLKGGYA